MKTCNKCNLEFEDSQFYKKSSSCKQCLKCIHGKQKQRCKYCGGSAFCEHDKQKHQCKICNSCIHNNLKYTCKDCNGSQICEHNIIKSGCKECGNKYCQHDKQKQRCKDCNGSTICQHDKEKYRCKECNGSAFCQHDKFKQFCKECNGSAFCQHDTRKQNCITCSPQIVCTNCKINPKARKKEYQPYCFMCYCNLNPNLEIPFRYRSKENLLAEELKEYNFINNKKINNGISSRRPDFLLDCINHIIIIECDEHRHSRYQLNEENNRINEIIKDLKDKPLILLRFNPDVCKESKKKCFDKDLKLIKGEWNKRIKILKKEINIAINERPTELIIIKYLFY
jgi:hypothetical protein